MKAKKQAAISCLEIVPGAVYLAPRRDEKSREDCPATISCTEEPGWLRGFVLVRDTRSGPFTSSGVVTVTFIEDGATFDIPVYRSHVEGSPWLFATGPEKWQPTTLRELPEGWFDQRLHVIQQEINEHTRKIGELEDLRSTVQALQHKVSVHASAG